MTPTFRAFFVAPLLLTAVACSDAGGDTGGGAGSSSSSAGASNTPSGGSGGSVNNVPLAGSGQAVGDGDQGAPFNPNDVVMIMPPEMGGMATGGSGGGPGIPGDGHEMTATMRRGMSGTAVFKQTGEDVTMTLDITGGCADGQHTITVHDGFACDSAGTEGNVWGERGNGIGSFSCSGNKGTLSHTRPGADKTKNWTVGDHVQLTDVTNHVLIIDGGGDPRAVCANFF